MHWITGVEPVKWTYPMILFPSKFHASRLPKKEISQTLCVSEMYMKESNSYKIRPYFQETSLSIVLCSSSLDANPSTVFSKKCDFILRVVLYDFKNSLVSNPSLM